MFRFHFDLPAIVHTEDIEAFSRHLEMLNPRAKAGIESDFLLRPLGCSSEIGVPSYVLFEKSMPIVPEEVFSFAAAKVSFNFHSDESSVEDYRIHEVDDFLVLEQEGAYLIAKDYGANSANEQLSDHFIMVHDKKTDRFFNYFVWTHHELPKFGFHIELASTRNLEWCVRTIVNNMDVLLKDFPPYKALKDEWDAMSPVSEDVVQRLESIDNVIHFRRLP